MNLIDIFRDDKHYYMVTDYCEGIELCEELIKRQQLVKFDVSKIIR